MTQLGGSSEVPPTFHPALPQRSASGLLDPTGYYMLSSPTGSFFFAICIVRILAYYNIIMLRRKWVELNNVGIASCLHYIGKKECILLLIDLIWGAISIGVHSFFPIVDGNN